MKSLTLYYDGNRDNKTENVLNQGTDIIMALDVSTSMEALDFEPVNRLEAAKKVAIDFVN